MSDPHDDADSDESQPESCCTRCWHWLCCGCDCCSKGDESDSNESEPSMDGSGSDEDRSHCPSPPNEKWRKEEYNPLSPSERAAVRAQRQYKAQLPGTYVSTCARRKQPGGAPRTPTQSQVLDVAPSPVQSVSEVDGEEEPPLSRRSSAIRFTEVLVLNTPSSVYPSEAQLEQFEPVPPQPAAVNSPASVFGDQYRIADDIVFSPSSAC